MGVYRITLATVLFLTTFLSVSYAQYPNAADYPFVAAEEEFKYLTGGTVVMQLHVDDAAVANIPIGFNFPFGNNTYTTGSASSNGWFSLSVSTGTGLGVNNDNRADLAPFVGNNSLPVFMPFWDDLGGIPNSKASYITTGMAPNREFTFEWRNWSWDYGTNPGTFTFQLKLYESGSFKFLYKRENGPISSIEATAGWFGGSIGFAKTVNDRQYLDGTVMTSMPSGGMKINMESRPFTGQTYMWMAPCGNLQTASIVGPSDACAGKTFRLAAVNEGNAISGNCQWSYSEDGISWNPLSPTAGVLTQVMAGTRWYRAKVTCGSAVYTTAPKLVKMAEHYKCYCGSSATVLTNAKSSSSMDIGRTVLKNELTGQVLIDNKEASLNLDNNAYSVKAYSDFTQEFSDAPIIYRDSTYRLTVNPINWGTLATGTVVAYIDFDHNSRFDYYEEVMLGQANGVLPNPYTVTTTFTVPDTAHFGLTRLRVILRAGTNKPDTCGNYTDGETEDYLVNVNYPPCEGPLDPGVVEGRDTSMCPGYAYLLTDTTYTKMRTGVERAWQISADGVYWSDINNSTNKDTLQRMFTGQPLYYKMMAICTNTDDTTFTDPFKINIKPTYKCYCHSQANGGMVKDSSDIGAFKFHLFEVKDNGAHTKNPKAHFPRSDYTDMNPVELIVDSSYTFHVFHTMPRETHADAKVTVFIDFNNNKKYDIPYERVFTGFTAIGYHTLISNVIIPNNVIVNMPTGMRVILNNEVAPNPQSDSACGEYTSGETEDFLVVFKRPFGVSVEPNTNTLDHVSAYPNPSAGKFNLQFATRMDTEVTVNVTSLTGATLFSQRYTHGSGMFNREIDLGQQPAGIYLVELIADGQRHMTKLVIR